MKKGLRRRRHAAFAMVLTLKPCPDEEGIKTRMDFKYFDNMHSLKPCPDEEGIKTLRAHDGLDAVQDSKTLP